MSKGRLATWGLIFLLLMVSTTSTAHEDDGEIDSEKGEHPMTPDDAPSSSHQPSSSSDLVSSSDQEEQQPTPEQIETMQAHCRNLEDHLQYLNARAVIQPEHLLFMAMHEALYELKELQQQTHKKDSLSFTCQEAFPWMMRSNHVSRVMHLLTEIFHGTGEVKPEGLTAAQIVDNLDQLQAELQHYGTVNSEVLYDVNKLKINMHQISEAYGKTNELINQQRHLLRKSEEDGGDLSGANDYTEPPPSKEQRCVAHYREFVSTLESFGQHHLPDWRPIEEGCKSLVDECKADDWISGRKKLPDS